MTPVPAAGSSQSHGSSMQNGPSSSTSDPHNAHTHYSSDNDDDSETEDEALQKEISRLREKYVTYLQSHFTLSSFTRTNVISQLSRSILT